MDAFHERKVKGIVYVLGEAGSGKTTLIDLIKENWAKIDESENALQELPKFIEGANFDFSPDKPSCEEEVFMCICHDISKPLPKKILNLIEANKDNEDLTFFLVLTKADLISDVENVVKSVSEMNLPVRIFAINKDKPQEKYGLSTMLLHIYNDIFVADMKLWTKDFGKYVDDTTMELKEEMSQIQGFNSNFKAIGVRIANKDESKFRSAFENGKLWCKYYYKIGLEKIRGLINLHDN